MQWKVCLCFTAPMSTATHGDECSGRRPFFHGLHAHHTPKAAASIDANDSVVVLNDLSVAVRIHLLVEHAFDIGGDHADAMGVVAFEVGLDQVLGNCLSVVGWRTRGGQYEAGDPREGQMFDQHDDSLTKFPRD